MNILIGLIVGLFVAVISSSNSTHAKVEKPQNIKPPLLFIQNNEQFDEEVAFYAKPMGLEVFITRKGEIVYSLTKKEDDSFKQTAFKETVVSKPAVLGKDRHQAVFNYFIGNDKSKWKSNVPTYQTIELGEVTKGINLNLKVKESNIEKLFYVSPGAEVKDILIKTQGGEMGLNDKGELIVKTPLGEITFTKPVAFQEIDGKRVDVKVSYRLQKDGYGFDVGNYDKTKPLIIDPLLASRYVGGAGTDAANAIAKDSSNNIYIAGYTVQSSSFPKTPVSPDPNPVYECSTCDGYDMTVSKFDSDLNMLASTFIGGNDNDICNDILIDGSGNVYLIGSTMSTNFPVGGSYIQGSNGGGWDAAFVALNNDLTNLLAGTYLGGNSHDKAYKGAFKTDQPGYIYIVGETTSDNFPVTSGVYQGSPGGGTDAFIVLVNTGFTILSASTYLGKTGADIAKGIVSMGGDGVIVVGFTNSTDFTSGATNAYGSYAGGVYDGYAAYLDAGLTGLIAARLFGGSGEDYAMSVVFDTTYLFITGTTNSPSSGTGAFGYDTGKFYGTPGSDDGNAFIIKMSSDLATVNVTAGIGGKVHDSASAIYINGSDVYIAGTTSSTSGVGLTGGFPVSANAYSTSNSGFNDAFIAKFSNGLDELQSATFIGGNENDTINGLLFANSALFACGETGSNDFPITLGDTFGGVTDQFVLKITPDLLAASGDFTITVNKIGSGIGTVTATGCTLIWTGATGKCKVDANTQITLTATANTGSTFAGWSGGTGSASACTGTGTCSFDITQNSSVTATFTLNQYTVTANAAGTGSGTVASNVGGISYSYPANNTGTTSALNHGTNVVLTATAGAGSTVSWTTCPGGTTAGNGTTTATCSFNNLDATKTAQATFTLNQYTLTVTKAGTGSGSVTGGSNCTLTWSGAGNNTGTCTVNSGTLINLSASAGANSIFTGWSGGTGSASGCTGTDDCIFSLNDDSQVTSFFNDINNIGQVYVNHGSGSVNSVYIGSMNADKDVYIVGPGAGSSQGNYALEYHSWTPLFPGNLIRVNFNGASFTGVPINLCLGSNNTNLGSSNPSAGATNHIFALSNDVANSDFIYFTDSACGSANRNRFPVRLLATNTPKMTTVRVDALTLGGIILDSTLAANLIEITSTAPQLNITKAGSGAGNVTASGCTLNWSGNTATCNVESGGNVTISATADGSSTFVGFTGAGCVGTSNCEVNNITSNKYLTATFRTNGAGNQINLPQTGQSTSYDSNTPKFDDGALRTGQYWPSSRFITGSPNGTVIDKLTGLMWMAAGNNPIIGSCTPSDGRWTDALDYVTCLNNNNYLDFSDWRLPNVNELASLFHSGQSNSATWLNSQGFSNIPTSSAWYWTSTTNTADTSSAITIASDNGSFVSDAKTTNNYVIAVRTSSYSPVLSKIARTGQTTSYDATRYGEDGDIQYGEPMPATRFSSSGSIVTDNLTGLKWASTANNPTVGSCTGGAMNWQASANYVSCLNNSNYLGYNDWRVPNKNELRSLIDYQNTAPALPSGYNSHFTGVQNSTYWTSTTVPEATTSAYTVNFSTGLLSNVVKTNNTPYVIPVRGGNISVVVSVSGSGIVKDSTNTINCGSQCDGSFEFSANNPIQFSFIPNSGKSLTSVVVNGMNLGPVHNVRIRSATHYLDIQATFSP